LLLGDDCSTDRTREIIGDRMSRNPRIRFVGFDTQQGKTAVINQLVPQARGTIIGFSDANTFWEPPSLRLMARHFADDRVGAVCGRLVLRSPTGLNTDDAYWQYETRIKRREHDLGVVLGAPGGIYTLRRELFRPLAAHVIQIDDFIWPVRVYEQGCRGVYEPGAVAHEEAAPHVEAEFRRKIRIGTGDYRALRECRRLLLPWSGWVAFCFWSHKVLRWLAPFLLLAALVSNALLVAEPLYRILFALQIGFYLAAGGGWLLSRQRHALAAILRVPYYFVGGNLALLIGCWKCLTGRQRATWSQKTHRPG
jgi:cellulose synthase/poly-beta-1,6-N-acetylglucosamine synthase-like glycosyltransferase